MRSHRWLRTVASLAVVTLLAMAVAYVLISTRQVADCVETSTASRRDVCFEGDGTVLAGSIYVPDGDGPFPAIVLLQGSGRTERAARFAASIADNGILVLTYDKRGVGRSGGRYCAERSIVHACFGSFESSLAELASDASAAVDVLADQSETDPDRLGLWGPSQGGWIAPMVAMDNGRVRFLVQHSAPAVSYDEEASYSRLLSSYPFDRFPDDAAIESALDEQTAGGFDPEDTLRQVAIPTLWQFGGRDRSIPVAASIERVREWVTVVPPAIELYPEADHDLRLPNEEGSPAHSIRDVWINWIKTFEP